MQILHTGNDRIGARGWWWDVDQVDRAGRRASLYHLARLDASETELTAVTPAEPLARPLTSSAVPSPPVEHALDLARHLLARERRAFGLRTIRRLAGRLHAWQLMPALALARGHGRVLVADAAGTGKTVSAAIALAECLDEMPGRRCLVVVPSPLVAQWCDELRRRVALDPIVCDAAGVRRLERTLPAGRAAWSMTGCLVAPLDYIKQSHVIPDLTLISWDLVVIDEAHAACGDSARRAACDAIARRARRLLLLTATPSDGTGTRLATLKTLGEGGEPLVTLRHAGVPSVAPLRLRRLLVQPGDALLALDVALARYAACLSSGPRRQAPEVRLLASLLTRRLISSAHALRISLERRLALLAGPPAPSQPSLFEPDDDDRILGTASGLQPVDEDTMLRSLVDLARRADMHDRRQHALERLIRRAADPAIVFSCYRDTALLLAARLAHCGARVIHGQQPPAVIESAVRAFTEGELRVLVATDVAAEGLNLHARCRRVIHYDLPWRPSTLQQRNGRIDRIGQTRRPHATVLLDDLGAARAAEAALGHLAARMDEDEPRTPHRWNVLAHAEAAGAGARRANRAPQQPRPLSRVDTHVIETVLLDRAGAIVERRGAAFAATPDEASRAAAADALRRGRALSRRLAKRARRRAQRERAVASAMLEPLGPRLRQDGLFDRRTERRRAADSAFAAAVERACREAVARHEAGADVAAARVRVIATVRAADAQNMATPVIEAAT